MIATGSPRVRVDAFGFMPDDPLDIVRRYTITNKSGASVKLISYGAGIQSVTVPNRNDDLADVVIGFDNLKSYINNRYIGRIVGRVTDSFRRRGRCVQDDPCAFDIVNWKSYILGDQVVMTHLSRDCQEGYCGDVMTQVKYTWTDENRLHVDIIASTTKPTSINIASHCLFNLAGHGTGPKELKSHVVTINADRCIEQDLISGCPDDGIKDVYETVYDLRCPKRLNKKALFKVPGGGYNHNLCVTSPSDNWSFRFHGRILHPASGRFMEVYSNHPALQVYTGNDLPDPKKIHPPRLDKEDAEVKVIEDRLIGKDGIAYRRHGCFGLIPLGYPESVMCNDFPTNILNPGKIYTHNITYEFGIIDK